jgi:hypothetical protein
VTDHCATANDLCCVIAAIRFEKGIPTSLVDQNTVTAATVAILNPILTSYYVAQGETAMSGMVDISTGNVWHHAHSCVTHQLFSCWGHCYVPASVEWRRKPRVFPKGADSATTTVLVASFIISFDAADAIIAVATHDAIALIIAIDVATTAFIVPVVNVVSNLAPVTVVPKGVVACVFDARCGGKETVTGKGGGTSLLQDFFQGNHPCSTIDMEPLTPLPPVDTPFSSIVTFIACFLAVHCLHPRLMMITL